MITGAIKSQVDTVWNAFWSGGIATTVFRGDAPMAHAGYLIRVRTNARATPDDVCAHLNSSHGKATLRGVCKSIAGTANINATEMRTIRIGMPRVEMQQEFSRRLGEIESLANSQSDALVDCDTVFTPLQHCAFRGEL